MPGEGWITVVRDRLTCEKQSVEIVVLRSKCAFVSMGIHSTAGVRRTSALARQAQRFTVETAFVQDLFGLVCCFFLWC